MHTNLIKLYIYKKYYKFFIYNIYFFNLAYIFRKISPKSIVFLDIFWGEYVESSYLYIYNLEQIFAS